MLRPPSEQLEINVDEATGRVDANLREHLLQMDDKTFGQFAAFVDTMCETFNEAMAIRSGDVEGGN